MKIKILTGLVALGLSAGFTAQAANESMTVFHDPNCGCCVGWIEHIRDAGYEVKAIQTQHMTTVKEKLGIDPRLASCHTAVIESTNQVIEGHVPAAAVAKLLANPDVRGVAVPGMPMNSPGMGPMDGNLVTVDFTGREFSRD
ncbi:DUF411 domain-containing protein [Orrella sp. 11846]|uniref:DUF411 domain-containing protein n=1 Tax=Orrella sp. 11846 TaxID=3409913 RepID=UPI003B5B381C